MEPELPRVPMNFEALPSHAKMTYPHLKKVPMPTPIHVSYPKCAPSHSPAPKTKLPYGMTPAIMSKPQKNFFTTY